MYRTLWMWCSRFIICHLTSPTCSKYFCCMRTRAARSLEVPAAHQTVCVSVTVNTIAPIMYLISRDIHSRILRWIWILLFPRIEEGFLNLCKLNSEHLYIGERERNLNGHAGWGGGSALCSGKITWFITTLWVSISNLASSWTSRSVSYRDKNSGMQTQTKVVRLGSLNWVLTSSTTACSTQSILVRYLARITQT